MCILLALMLLCCGWPTFCQAAWESYGYLAQEAPQPTTLLEWVLLKIAQFLSGMCHALPVSLVASVAFVLNLCSFVRLIGPYLTDPTLTVGAGGGLALLMCVQVGLCGVVAMSLVFLPCVPALWRCPRVIPGAIFMGWVAVGVFFASDGFLLYWAAFAVSMGACIPLDDLTLVVQSVWFCLLLGLVRLGGGPYRKSMDLGPDTSADEWFFLKVKRLFAWLAILQGLCVVVGCCYMFGFMGWLELLVHLYSTLTPFVVDPAAIDTLMHHHIVHAYGVGSSILWDATYYQTLVGGGSFFI